MLRVDEQINLLPYKVSTIVFFIPRLLLPVFLVSPFVMSEHKQPLTTDVESTLSSQAASAVAQASIDEQVSDNNIVDTQQPPEKESQAASGQQQPEETIYSSCRSAARLVLT